MISKLNEKWLRSSHKSKKKRKREKDRRGGGLEVAPVGEMETTLNSGDVDLAGD